MVSYNNEINKYACAFISIFDINKYTINIIYVIKSFILLIYLTSNKYYRT